MSNVVTPPRRPAKRNTGLQPLSPNNPAASPSTSALSRSQPLAQQHQHHDPAIDKALQLSTFEANYSTEDFISTLSDKLIQESKANPGPFDPKPFLQTFSPALDQLLSLRGQVAERTKKMETEVRRAEREYGRRLRELDGGFEVCQVNIRNFSSMLMTRLSAAHFRIWRPKSLKSADRQYGQESNWNHYIKLDRPLRLPRYYYRTTSQLPNKLLRHKPLLPQPRIPSKYSLRLEHPEMVVPAYQSF